MFQKRKGARYLKTLTPIERIMPHVMPKRSDSQVFFTDDVDCTAIDAYIKEKREQGIDMTYLDESSHDLRTPPPCEILHIDENSFRYGLSAKLSFRTA